MWISELQGPSAKTETINQVYLNRWKITRSFDTFESTRQATSPLPSLLHCTASIDVLYVPQTARNEDKSLSHQSNTPTLALFHALNKYLVTFSRKCSVRSWKGAGKRRGVAEW